MADVVVEGPERAPGAVLTAREKLTYFGITGEGTLQARELYRFMERTGPQWWLPVSGMTREAFWRTRQHALVALGTEVRILAGGCRPGEPVTVEHTITHGRRQRVAREPEYGFVDALLVRRDSDDSVLADLTSHTVWVDLREGRRGVAAAPPEGLDCPLEELPPLESFPKLGEPVAEAEFTWTVREAEVTNSHVAFSSYAERAENTLFDAGLQVPDRPRWRGRYRFDFVTGDRTAVTVAGDGDDLLVGFAAAAEPGRPRVVLRLSGAAL